MEVCKESTICCKSSCVEGNVVVCSKILIGFNSFVLAFSIVIEVGVDRVVSGASVINANKLPSVGVF